MLSCQSDLTDCSGVCVNLQTDLYHCGKCSAACKAGQVCSKGQCALWCQSGLTDCIGQCVNLNKDNNNCGACASICALGTVCKAGKCVAACGNAAIDPGEQCDLQNLGGKTCKTLGFHDGGLGCSDTCSLETDGCHNCGDGKLDAIEACDGNKLSGKTCKSLGFKGGKLTCLLDCTISTSACFSCKDKLKNGAETDVDCGGPDCTPCANTQKCAAARDCAHRFCRGGLCDYPINCAELLKANPKVPSGQYMVAPKGPGSQGLLKVLCDMITDGGGWTLVMRGLGGAVLYSFWATTWQYNSSAALSVGKTFKFSDATINGLRHGGIYRLLGDGNCSGVKRFVPSSCTYSHMTHSSKSGCAVTYSDVKLSTGKTTADSTKDLYGISDFPGGVITTHEKQANHVWWCKASVDRYGYNKGNNFTMWVR